MQDGGFTPLIYAANAGQERSVEMLLQAKADANMASVGCVNILRLIYHAMNGCNQHVFVAYFLFILASLHAPADAG